MEDHGIFYGIEPGDLHSFFIGFGISTGYGHHGSGGTFVNLQINSIQGLIGHGLKYLYQIVFYPRDDYFGLGISHTDVIFDYFGFFSDLYQADEYKSLIGQVIQSKAFYGRLYDPLEHSCHEDLIREGNGG